MPKQTFTRTLTIDGVAVDMQPSPPLRYRTLGRAWEAYGILSAATREIVQGEEAC